MNIPNPIGGIIIRHSPDDPEMMELELNLIDEKGVSQSLRLYQKKAWLLELNLTLSQALVKFFYPNDSQK